MEHARTYTKRDVAQRVALHMNATLHSSEEWTDRVFLALREIMESADPELRIEIRNFGVLEVKVTRARPHARNPKTGEVLHIPARRKTHFKPGKGLRAFLCQPLNQTEFHEVPANVV